MPATAPARERLATFDSGDLAPTLLRLVELAGEALVTKNVDVSVNACVSAGHDSAHVKDGHAHRVEISGLSATHRTTFKYNGPWQRDDVKVVRCNLYENVDGVGVRHALERAESGDNIRVRRVWSDASEAYSEGEKFKATTRSIESLAAIAVRSAEPRPELCDGEYRTGLLSPWGAAHELTVGNYGIVPILGRAAAVLGRAAAGPLPGTLIYTEIQLEATSRELRRGSRSVALPSNKLKLVSSDRSKRLHTSLEITADPIGFGSSYVDLQAKLNAGCGDAFIEQQLLHNNGRVLLADRMRAEGTHEWHTELREVGLDSVVTLAERAAAITRTGEMPEW